MFPATLTTERLVLRPPRTEDAEAVFERYGSDPEVTRYLSWKTHASVEDAREFLASIIDPPETNRDQHWMIGVEGDERPSGCITTFGVGRMVTLGYVLSQTQWKRGIMTEALRAVADAVWQDSRTWRLQALAHVDNVASQRLMEKCGLRYEGVLRRRFMMPQLGPDPLDCALYAQVRDDL